MSLQVVFSFVRMSFTLATTSNLHNPRLKTECIALLLHVVLFQYNTVRVLQVNCGLDFSSGRLGRRHFITFAPSDENIHVTGSVQFVPWV